MSKQTWLMQFFAWPRRLFRIPTGLVAEEKCHPDGVGTFFAA